MLDFEQIGAAIGQRREVEAYNRHLTHYRDENEKLAQEIANLKILLMKKTCFAEAVDAQGSALVAELRRVDPGNALFIKTGRKHPNGNPETRLGAIFPKAFDAEAVKIGLPNYKTHRVEAV